MEVKYRPNVLLLPYPSQGHINPLLQLAKRLSAKGLKPTLLITNFISKSTQQQQSASCTSVEIETISDGYDDGGFADAESIDAYLTTFQKVGSQTLIELIKKQESSGHPVSCLVYDSFLSWGLDVAKGLGIYAAAFFTQPCSVNTIYYHIHHGTIDEFSTSEPNISVNIPALPPLKVSDLPSMVYLPTSYPAYLELVLNQYLNLEKADLVFVNTFQELEPEVVEWQAKHLPVRTIGPTVPSMYLDKRIQDDTDYGVSLYKPESSICMNWLHDKPIASVVYVSSGSLSDLGVEQMEELALGIKHSDCYFLWVVRASEEHKLPPNFKEENTEKGLIVKWCSQLDVLAHKATGCFVTHCGWNSTLEGLSLGVPMVGIPQWTDQPTNAKFIEDVWGVGVRAGIDEKGIVRKDEVERCVRVIMEGERGVEIKKKAAMWKTLAKEAVDEGGSSDKNIDEFVSKMTAS